MSALQTSHFSTSVLLLDCLLRRWLRITRSDHFYMMMGDLLFLGGRCQEGSEQALWDVTFEMMGDFYTGPRPRDKKLVVQDTAIMRE